MRIIQPATRNHDAVTLALAATGHSWQRIDVSGSDDAYWNLLAQLWRDAQTFCIVEHDILVRPSTLTELETCPQPWCGHLADYVGMPDGYAGLSCTKFTADLLLRNRNAIERIATISDTLHPPKHWCRLDAWLQAELTRNGETMCVHGPALTHLRPVAGKVMPSHGCWP